MLGLFLCGEFLLHISCWLHFYLGSFSYTSRAGFIFISGVSEFYKSRAGFFFIWEVSLTRPVLASFLSGEFLLHIPCWLLFFLLFFKSGWRGGGGGEFLLHIPCWLYFYQGSFSYNSHAGFFLFYLYFILSGEFLLHIPCWLHFYLGSFRLLQISFWLLFYLGSFSYTSRAGLIFIW